MDDWQREAFDNQERERTEKAKAEPGGESGRKEAKTKTEADAEAPPEACSGAAWRAKVFPPPEYLLGNVFHRGSRWLGYASTGTGKTLFFLDMLGALAAGKPFLDWEGSSKPRRVMYIDGEVSKETMQERIIANLDRYGCDETLFVYCRDDLESGEMPPLDTEAGWKWLARKIVAVKPDVICFDAIAFLAPTALSDEEAWGRVQELILSLTKRGIAQVWINHTGHNEGHSYGLKLKEWAMTAVLSLRQDEKATALAQSACVELEFEKARERKKSNWAQFRKQKIEYDDVAGWSARVGIDHAETAAEDQAFFLRMLGLLDRRGQNVSSGPKTSKNYAPRLISQMEESETEDIADERRLERAMNALLEAKKINTQDIMRDGKHKRQTLLTTGDMLNSSGLQ
jgi:RecA-family ATPase